jgi:hypothetical protein
MGRSRVEATAAGRWLDFGRDGGWTCCVDQGHYGHRAQKATWLYAVGVQIPMLTWGKAPGGVRLDEGFHSSEERAAARRRQRTGLCQRLSKRQRIETPVLFRDLLLSMARAADVSAQSPNDRTLFSLQGGV